LHHRSVPGQEIRGTERAPVGERVGHDSSLPPTSRGAVSDFFRSDEREPSGTRPRNPQTGVGRGEREREHLRRFQPTASSAIPAGSTVVSGAGPQSAARTDDFDVAGVGAPVGSSGIARIAADSPFAFGHSIASRRRRGLRGTSPLTTTAAPDASGVPNGHARYSLPSASTRTAVPTGRTAGRAEP
jgi:hypothetical protein